LTLQGGLMALNMLHGWEAYIWDSLIPHWMPVSVLVPYLLHLFRVFQPLRDDYHDALKPAVDSLEREIVGRLAARAPGFEPASIIPRWEFGQAMAAMERELARGADGRYRYPRSIDAVVLGFISTGDPGADQRKVDFYRKALADTIRQDTLLVPYPVESARLKGSAVTYGMPWIDLKEHWDDWKARGTDLPQRFEEAQVMFFLVGDDRNGSDFELFELAHGSTTFIPLPVQYRGRKLTSAEAWLAHQYRMAQQHRKASYAAGGRSAAGEPHGLKIISRGNNYYKGPQPSLQAEGITDLSVKKSANDVVLEGLGWLIPNGAEKEKGADGKDSAPQVETIREKPTRRHLEKTVEGSPVLRNRIDKKNVRQPQYDAAVGVHVIHLSPDLQVSFSNLIRMFISEAQSRPL
jgi:hypothetical protein